MPDTAETAHITAPRSMAHLLRTTLMAVGILSLLLSVVGAALLFQHAFAEQFDTDLSRTVEAIAVGYEHSADPQPEQLAQYADGLRLTLVAQDGTVLYDSATADPSTLPNHANRPEIQQAMAEGTGASVRRSATLGYDTHYYAVRLTDGSVLRLADETSNMWSSYNRVLPVLVAGCILIIILALVLAQVITKHLVQPITRMAEHLDCIEANVPYEELIPLAHTVQSDRKLREDNETIRREFTANVSHELKTPLTSISGYAELIENGMAKQEDIPTFGHRIHKEAQRMITLVSDILQLSGKQPHRRFCTGGPWRAGQGCCHQHDGERPQSLHYAAIQSTARYGARQPRPVDRACNQPVRQCHPLQPAGWPCGAELRHQCGRLPVFLRGGQWHRHPTGQPEPRV